MPEATKLSNGALRTLQGIDTTKHADSTAQPDNISFISRFTKTEMQSFLRGIYTAPETRYTDLTAAGIIPYLKTTHAKIGNKRLNTDKMRALAPEIDQSRILVSASIMSPNDLQDGEFIFSFDNVSGIGDDPDLSKEIAEVFDYFFNKVLNLGVESYDWIGEIMYSSGCKPILILPVATQKAIRNRTPEDIKHDQNNRFKPLDFGLSKRLGMESFAEYSTRLSKEDNTADFFYSQRLITWKEVLENSTPTADIVAMTPAMEAFSVPSPFGDLIKQRATVNSNSNYDIPAYQAGLEDMIVNLRTRLEEGDVIKVSENPEVLRFGVTSKKTVEEMMMGNLARQYNPVEQPVIEDIVELDPDPKNFEHEGHPTLIRLPAESVVPIYLHGTPSEHLGYFVLLDQNGQPLTIENSGMMDTGTGCHAGSPAAAYEAIFGAGCCSNSNRFLSNTQDVANAGGVMFQFMIEKYLRARLAGIFGRDDLELSRWNALATILFSRLLARKHTTLVFAPPELLHYFAFDYDKEDGTGVAKTDDIQHLLSMRATYMVAAVMAMANDAIEQKTVTFGVDDKNANLEAIMDHVANVFIGKNKLTGSIDPSEIMRDIYSNNLVIIPRNLPGISDLNVEVSNNGINAVRPDNELIEQITNLIVSHLDVPPAALNQLSEPEYARSLVTYNLFFAKKISRYQRIWCAQIESFIRSYLRYDIPVQQAILKRLQAAGKRSVHEELPEKVEKLKRRNPNRYTRNTASHLLTDIINGFEVRLPKPNIVVDNAQFEQIRNFLSNLDEMANQFFNQEIVPSDDMNAQAALPIMRAKWKRDQLMRFLENVGNFTMVDTPNMDDMDSDDVVDMIQTLQNINTRLAKQRETVGNLASAGAGADMGGGSFGGDEFGGGSGDMDMGGDMGGDDFGMGDMGGGEVTTEEPEEPAGGSEEDTGTPGSGGNEPVATMYASFMKNRRR